MPHRTNACAICRKKRIKCDATLPECLMCIKYGRQCPGPGNGPIIIDMSTKTAPKKTKSITRPKETVSGTSNYPPELIWGLSMPISQRNALSQLFYDRFLIYFTSSGESEDILNRFTWLHRLPTLATDGSNDALALALYATASAFSGMKTRNISQIHDACTIYGKALQTHSRIIRSKKPMTLHTVSTSVLLSIFEAMNATSATAYREHISGAAKMIQLAGSEHCQHGVMCQLYFHIRTQMAFVYLTTHKKEEELVPVEMVLRENLFYEKIPIFQRLVTFITQLSEIYVGIDEGNIDEAGHALDLEVYMEVKAGIAELWQEFTETYEAKGRKIQWKNEQGATMYYSPFTALSIAFFATAYNLFAILAPHLAATYLDFTDHYQRVLDAAAFLRAFRIGCAYMRIAAPLYLVALHAPQKYQKDMALLYFEEWRKIGMGGISALALDSIAARSPEYRRRRLALNGGSQAYPTLDICDRTRGLEEYADQVQNDCSVPSVMLPEGTRIPVAPL
ncbi:hypothetical protein DM02DRAFT_610971 [Periconia macrospinosa]|uniref:Zn(2)-C6 fungal-type domain-containing protein n=1 Tax=Periconia macrospinosa TaxID=97972 RepID=A0A2V1E769_9PLEO|nr:hypothetical protein DM02DRAFT_610971 [Periconia macrospinosa]